MIQPSGPSLARNSIATFISYAVKVAFGFVSVVVTSRWLGPEGKGTLSTLLLVGVLASYACSLGLGDAAVFFVQRKQFDVSEALSASLIPVIVASLFGIGLLWVTAWVADWRQIHHSVQLASLLLPVATLAYLLASFEEAAERLVVTGIVSAVSSIASTLATVGFIVFLKLDVFGGVLAALLAATFSLVALIFTLRSQGVQTRPKLNLLYLKAALRYGTVVEASFILVSITSRADLLVVYALLGPRSAGWYAVALTLGELVAYAPDAVSVAAFPRLAGVGGAEARELAPRIFRVGVAAAIVGASALTVVIPVLVPIAFGQPFLRAIPPAIVLTWGAVLWSAQWLLCRMGAARGYTRAYFACFATTATLMIGLDILLLRFVGMIGASVIASVSSGLGFLLALLLLRRRLDLELSSRNLWPRRNDFRELARVFSTWRGV